jgi:hypothetical protein
MTSRVTTTSSSRSKTASAGSKDFLTRLTEAGEDALQRLSELPGGQKAVSALNDLRARVDDLNRKVRGLDELEARVAKLEKEIASLKRSSSSRSSSKPGAS